jgi:hypothetical protein
MVGDSQSHKSRNRPGVAQRVPGVQAPRFHDIRHMKVVRLSALLTGRLYPQEMFLVLIFNRGWVNPRAMVRSEENTSLKNPVTLPGIDPGTVRLVAQRLKHHATPGPFRSNKSALTKKYNVLSTFYSVVTTELKLFRDINNKFSSSFSYKNGKFD